MPIKTTHYPTQIPFVRTTRTSPVGLIVKAYSIWRERNQLAKLDDAALCDIGKSREEAKIEASRPVWDAPNRWLL